MLANPLFINGTSSKHSYIVIARRGDVVLGLRPLGLAPGKVMGLEDRTILQVRLRSAKITPEIEQALQSGDNVVSFSKATGYADAWPKIQFSKLDDQRASMILLTPIRGDITGSNKYEMLEKLIKGQFVEALASKVCDLAEPEHVVVRSMLVADHIRKTLKLLPDQLVTLQKLSALDGENKKYLDDLPEEPVTDSVVFAKLKEMQAVISQSEQLQAQDIGPDEEDEEDEEVKGEEGPEADDADKVVSITKKDAD